MSYIAIFDIGKTNKKFFLFDQQLREVGRDYTQFEETTDEDGFPCDDLDKLVPWMQETFAKASSEYSIKALNFSTYGASFVHVGREGQPVTPLYNYIKPFPEDLLQIFYQKYGGWEAWAQQTASPPLGMLNSGLQIYWLKKTKPELFAKIKTALHLPQFCSYLFTGKAVSEYTSIGCHTGMWNFKERDYHRWIYDEDVDVLLPRLAPAYANHLVDIDGKEVYVGMGIHDSSAALLPYIVTNEEPFLLISTGTWSITLNPFNTALLTEEELLADCLNFMRVDGKPVKAARLFLGNEYKLQVKKLHQYFGKEYGYHRSLQFDPETYKKCRAKERLQFRFESIHKDRSAPTQTDLFVFPDFETAYHQLMIELVDLQIEAVLLAQGRTPIKRIYIDGGFVDNDIFVKLLAMHFKAYEVITTKSPLGSALGAAMAVYNKNLDKNFLLNHFELQRQEPVML